jgi:outer membrane lipoprotein carrier protein
MARCLVALLLALCLVLGAPPLNASGKEQLDRFLEDTQSLRADFAQTVTDANGKVIQQGQGEMLIARPGRFRWEYRKPYEQLIVSDGKRLWVYDPELEQVTVKSVDEALGNTPALLLAGVHPLEQDFKIRETAGPGDALAWVELLPKAEDTHFVRILLGFAGQQLEQMALYDSFGQVTRLDFEDAQRNPPLAPESFRFEPPPGVDVVGEE